MSSSVTTTHEDEDPAAIVLVSRLGPYDVLLGRGTGANEYQGNKYFRGLVLRLKDHYQSACTHMEAKAVVLSALRDIEAKGGRFLAKNTTHPHINEDYIVVSEATAIRKTNQAFRYSLRRNSNASSQLRGICKDRNTPDVDTANSAKPTVPKSVAVPLAPEASNAPATKKDVVASHLWRTSNISPQHLSSFLADVGTSPTPSLSSPIGISSRNSFSNLSTLAELRAAATTTPWLQPPLLPPERSITLQRIQETLIETAILEATIHRQQMAQLAKLERLL
eukprot:Nitzschia sp. Nitz4//scaffold292_size23309//19879//20800//NITZ4_008500-RA/size23309-augustus-gene-0.4-mRNA-1//1//CDS//3329546179//7176//frame0